MSEPNHAERAVDLFREGYNCAQAVFAAAEAGCDGKRLELRFEQREAVAETTM